MPTYITSLTLFPVRVPLEAPVLAPQLEIGYRDYLLVRIECSDETWGIGFSYIGTGGALSAAEASKELIAGLVLGADPSDPEALQRRLKFATRIQGRGGIIANALSAIDIALWDRNARVQGLPLYKAIGAGTVTQVPAYASGGYLTGRYRQGDLEREIKSYLDAGFRSIKLKCAFGALDEDMRRVNAARRFMGDDTNLMLDAYNRWSSVEDALPSVKAYMDVNPYWVEDPFEPDMLAAFEGLKEAVPCRLATGEFYFGPPAFETLAASGATDVFQAEAPRCGGISDWLKIAGIAAAHGIEMSPCWFHDLHVHLVAATPAASFVEYFPTFDVLNFGVLIDRPVRAQNGYLPVPQDPGLGFQFRSEIVERYTLGKATVLEHEPTQRRSVRQ